MTQFAQILHLVLILVLTGLVMIQAKGGGLSSMVGSGTMYRSRRGLEKVVFVATIISGSLFALNSLLMLYLN